MSDQTIPRRTVAPGEIFGRLTVLSEAPRRKHFRYWLCQCSCGSPPKEIRHNSLGELTKSCGCLRAERAQTTGRKNSTHGRARTPEYIAWNNMWGRCTNPNDIGYLDYKDRLPPAIWRDFQTFFDDMGPRPSPKHSLERVDNSKPYGPSNCVWATLKEQNRNKSTNVNIEYQGRLNCIASWAEEFNMKPKLLGKRLKAGWPIDKALNTKVGN